MNMVACLSWGPWLWVVLGHVGGITGSWMRPHALLSFNNECLGLTLRGLGFCFLGSFYTDVVVVVILWSSFPWRSSCLLLRKRLKSHSYMLIIGKTCAKYVIQSDGPEIKTKLNECSSRTTLFSNLQCCLPHRSPYLSRSNLNICVIVQAFGKKQPYWFWQRVNR